MADQAQISATVSATTKAELDRFAEGRGLKKNFVVEQALLLYMQARRELPDDAFLPTRIVLEDAAFDSLTAMLANPPPATDPLRGLMRGESR